MPLHEDQAICVRVWDWSETSQTVSLFSRNLGLLRCVAKGSKRNTTSAFSGGVDMLTLGGMAAHIKPGRDLSILSAWDLAETFPVLRRDLACHYAGLYIAELIQRLAADHDPHPRLFDTLLASLRSLRSVSDVPGVLLRFQWSALNEAGYRPVLDRLPDGGGLPADAKSFQFDPSIGAISAADPARGQPDWVVRASTVATLREIGAEVAGGEAPMKSLDPAIAIRGAKFLAAYTRYVLGAQPATLALVFPDLSGAAPRTRS